MQWITQPKWARIPIKSVEQPVPDAAFTNNFNADIEDPDWNVETPEDRFTPEEDLIDINDAKRSLADPSPRISLVDLRRELDFMFVIIKDSEDESDCVLLCQAKHFKNDFDKEKFQEDWDNSITAVKEMTGAYGYVFGHVDLEMKKRGWILTIMEHLKLVI